MNKKVYGLIGIAALAAVGGTFAYYNASQTFENPFNTTKYSTSSTEKFNPEDAKEWKPGAKVEKKVFATNTGEGPVWVRVKFNEEWARGTDTFGIWDSGAADGAFFPATSSNAGRFQDNNHPGKPYNGEELTTHQPMNGVVDDDNNVIAGEKDGTLKLVDGKLQDDGSVVYKELLNVLLPGDGEQKIDPNASENAKKWYYGSDGWFYYTVALNPTGQEGSSTETLLNSVTLCGNTDMGLFEDIEKWLVVPKDTYKDKPDPIYPQPEGQWTDATPSEDQMKNSDVYHYQANRIKEVNGEEQLGYADASYTLDITVEFVQATEKEEEADAMFESLRGEGKEWAWWPGKAVSSTPTTP